jgi:UDP-N-acetylmuramoylalanine--D-glutamate ligase
MTDPIDIAKLDGVPVLVVGLGKSGRAAARFLAERGAKVTANDSRPSVEGGEALEAAGVTLALGGHDEARFTGASLIVLSPGVPPLAELDAAEAAGVPIWSEVELASRFLKGTLVAVTGTNGKSTVTSWIAAMGEAAGIPTFAGGNLGTPLVEAVGTEAGERGLVVAEVSSFQLERVDRFRPKVAVLLNVSEDHLDRYESYADYVAAKGRIFIAQGADDHAVVPMDDEVCLGLAKAGAAAVHTFGPGGELRIEKGTVRDHASGLEVPVDALALVGGPNELNACAAALAARLAGVDTDAIRAALVSFDGLSHRMERVGALRGVTFYDDSKATNVGATVAAIRGFADGPGKVVLIAGGRDKGGSYAPLREALAESGRAAVLIGEAAATIEEALGDAVPVARRETMAEAVTTALEHAQVGDAVLLAPACSSFDMYGSYAERGDDFQRAVREHGAVR